MVWDDSHAYVNGSRAGAAPALDRPLGYSWFLRALRLVSRDPGLILLSQVTLGLVTGVLFWQIYRSFSPGVNWPGAVVLLLVLVWPNNLLHEGHILSEALFLFVTAAGTYLLLLAWRRHRLSIAAAAGLVLGYAALVRLQGLFACVCGALFLLLYARSGTPLSHHRLSGTALRMRPAVCFALGCALPILAYSQLFYTHHGVRSLSAWSGIVRYSMIAHLIEPRFGQPEAATVAFLKRYDDDHKGGYAFLMWNEASPLRKAPAELALTPVQLNRWAQRIAVKTAAHRPRAFLSLVASNLVDGVRHRSYLYTHTRFGPDSSRWRAMRAVYGVDISDWHERETFPLRFLAVLREFKYAMVVGLLVSLVVLARSPFTNPGYFLTSMSTLGVATVLSATLPPEERHLNVAENFLILGTGVLLADIHAQLSPRWHRRRAAEPPAAPRSA